MTEHFFEKPILNAPYAFPARHWELDADGQPTNRIIETRRRSDLITPVPKLRISLIVGVDFARWWAAISRDGGQVAPDRRRL